MSHAFAAVSLKEKTVLERLLNHKGQRPCACIVPEEIAGAAADFCAAVPVVDLALDVFASFSRQLLHGTIRAGRLAFVEELIAGLFCHAVRQRLTDGAVEINLSLIHI